VRLSHDLKSEAFIYNHNIAVRAVGSTERTILSYDGMEGDAYTLGSILWSPDSKKLAAFRVRPGYRRMIPYIESSPSDQVQPKFSTRRYEKPGDPRDRQLPAVFNVETKQQFRLPESMVPHAYDLRRPAWREDSRAFTFEYNERGHLRYQVQEIDATTGASRVVIDEHQPGTYFSYYSTLWRQDVNDGREILWMSERDGWKHIWLYDGTTGRVKNQVTKGQWVVRGVDSVDAGKRQVWFTASGMYAGKDPYLIHHYRINFDGTGLTTFTEGDGAHSVTWSPNREYYVDTWSRVDQPPVMELRRTSDQRRLMELERTDVSAVAQTGWRAPEVFTAKGRDGTSDIWGIILRPTNFDPSKKYPVIEYIYAGPHNHFVPKTFSLQAGMQSLAELGFIVVQIDGMGTAQRSKAFHDVSWKDIGDAGFPDRILWHKAVAAKYPGWYDISRVGIYGTSAGGQNSTGALLFHPEFYHVAVSAVGCHDNRMDKISWNEQWMSYPIGPEYAASSNVDNAHKLQGKLLLVVGELDTNVDPQSTMQVVNALVRANKSHDLLFLPGAGHGSGGAFGTRMRNDFFVRHLLGVTPPNWNRDLAAATAPNGLPGDWLELVDEDAPGANLIWR
jgi:dipeptidyl aminopeptidase/acylaminoacyl peptidase